MNAAARTRFDTLDAIRGIAALMVVPRHTELFGTSWADSHSYLAVDLFFILSGFVIASAYEPHLRSQTLSTGKFVLIRLVRFYPVLILGTVLAAMAVLLTPNFGADGPAIWRLGDTSVAAILASSGLTLLFLPARLGESSLLFPLNTAVWSLMYEMFINILFVLTLRWWTPRALWTLVIGSAILMAAMGLRVNSIDLGWAWSLKSVIGGTVRTVFGFATGVLLFRLFSERSPGPRPIYAVPALVLAAGPLLIPDLKSGNGLVDVLATLVAFPLAIWLGAHAQVKARTAWIFALLGAISYPIYVLHVPMLRLYEQWVQSTGLGSTLTDAGLTATFFAGLLLVAAWALDRHYDQPIRNWLQQALRLRSRQPAAGAHRRAMARKAEVLAVDSSSAMDLEIANRLLAADDPIPAAGSEGRPSQSERQQSSSKAVPGIAP